MFEKDLHLPWLDQEGWDEVETLLKTTDVFHFHMTADEFIELGPFRPVDYMRGKVIVHHHHGHPDFRGNPEKYRQKYRERERRNLLVSTPDLLKRLSEAKWQPNLVPIDDPLYMPLRNKPKKPVIISHSPTQKELKNTAQLLQAVNELKMNSSVPIELRLIENIPHKECLRLKRESHILFDHLQGYFGVSSLEGLSHGLCVIAGLDEWNIQCVREFTGVDRVPWVVVRNEAQLTTCIRKLVLDRELRRDLETRSRGFMTTCWTEQHVIKALLDVYATL